MTICRLQRILVAVTTVWMSLSHDMGGQAAVPLQPVSATEFDALLQRLSNWGRWGQDDQIGTLNLLTAETRLAASRLVREGTAVSLSRRIGNNEEATEQRRSILEMLATASTPNVTAHTDEVTLAPHGAIYSHFDAPSHFFYKGEMYNGVPRSEVTERGAARLSVDHASLGVFTRGVLLDIARLKSVRALHPGYPISIDDLEAALKATGLTLRPGDALLIRTGRAVRPPGQRAGLHVSTVQWLKQRDVALVGSDDSIDAWPSGVDGVRSPIHVLLLVAMGTPILDHLNLDALAMAAAERSRWEFLLTVAPLPVVGATGSVVNPIAYF